MKWYEWMKASVLRYQLSDVFTHQAFGKGMKGFEISLDID